MKKILENVGSGRYLFVNSLTGINVKVDLAKGEFSLYKVDEREDLRKLAEIVRQLPKSGAVDGEAAVFVLWKVLLEAGLTTMSYIEFPHWYDRLFGYPTKRKGQPRVNFAHIDKTFLFSKVDEWANIVLEDEKGKMNGYLHRGQRYTLFASQLRGELLKYIEFGVI